ncbi:MAG: hypothetical protein ACLT3Y_01585 [Ruminococcus callidus]
MRKSISLWKNRRDQRLHSIGNLPFPVLCRPVFLRKGAFHETYGIQLCQTYARQYAGTACQLCVCLAADENTDCGKRHLHRKAVSTQEYTQTISATRGEIVDSSGKAIIENKVGYNVIIEPDTFPEDNAKGNQMLLSLVNILDENGVEWEHFPADFRYPAVHIHRR